MNGINCVFFCLLLAFTGKSQSDSLLMNHTNTRTLKRLGKNALLQNDPGAAVNFFKAYLKAGPNDAVALEGLARAYMQLRDYENAEHAFLRAYKMNKAKAPEALYYHALMQKSNEKYDSAKINFKHFKKEYKGNDKTLKKQCGKEIAFCDSIQNVLKSEKKIVLQHLGGDINKVNTEGAPFNFDDNTLLFTSLRTDKREYTVEGDTLGPKRKLYYASKENEEWKFKGEYGDGLNGSGFNLSNAAFSPDRKRLYFTRCRPNFKDKMICAIYVTEKKGDSWTDPVALPKPINSKKYTSTMPAVGIDPVKGNDVIFFVSDRKGGKGGLDIWYSVYDKKSGSYRVPKNAGSKVNTPQNEITPFIDTETRSMYFSSDGLGGLGGYDVFLAAGNGKKWSNVENIGPPVNTGADDVYYTISTNRQEGFFVSNRKGGNSLKDATCCDDIYYYKRSEYIRLALKGAVHDALDPTTGIKDVNIEVYIKDKLTKEKRLVKTIRTDSLGNYQTTLEPDQDYYFVAKKDEFLGSSEEISTKGVTGSVSLDKDLKLIKRPKDVVHLPDIKTEFGKTEIAEESKVALDTTVLKLMLDNPELIIEIQAHTDSKGTEAFNNKLSQKRAESMANYLISKGVDPKHIKAKGYGESKPIAPNENPDGSDNPTGRAKNRRIDFKIIGVIDAEIINDASVE